MGEIIMDQFTEKEINGVLWKFRRKYDYVEYIDEGTYGDVSKFYDKEKSEEVAIKRMKHPFLTEAHAKRALREVKLLKFCQHENLLAVTDAYTTASSARGMIDFYLVTPWMDMSLAYLINEHVEGGLKISFEHVELIMYQIVRGLKYLHSANVIHRDLKPDNITVTPNGDVTIIDYGLCRAVANDMTYEVQSRPYRAPEVIFSSGNYTVAADMWSVGCILGEMVLMDMVFPAESDDDLFGLQIEICGSPGHETMDFFKCPDLLRYITEERGVKERKNFGVHFKCEKSAVLLNRLLEMDPRKRLMAEAALEHPYFETYHYPDDEPIAASVFDPSFETKHEMNDLKKAIFDELF